MNVAVESVAKNESQYAVAAVAVRHIYACGYRCLLLILFNNRCESRYYYIAESEIDKDSAVEFRIRWWF